MVEETGYVTLDFTGSVMNSAIVVARCLQERILQRRHAAPSTSLLHRLSSFALITSRQQWREKMRKYPSYPVSDPTSNLWQEIVVGSEEYDYRDSLENDSNRRRHGRDCTLRRRGTRQKVMNSHPYPLVHYVVRY
jgi:hypothetical protein